MVFNHTFEFLTPRAPVKASVMFSKRRFGKLYFSLIISLKKTIRIIEIFTKIILNLKEKPQFFCSSSGHPEGESEIDFNAGEFALSLKIDCKTELRRKF